VRAVNVGGAPTLPGEDITIIATISGPAGVEPQFASGYDTRGSELECEISGQTVTCVDEVYEGPVEPGQEIQLSIRLKSIPNEASGVVVNNVTISGGGAGPASTTGEAAITATEGPWGFLPGAAGFETVLRNSQGEEDTEAGTHPYTLTVTNRFPAKKFGPFSMNVPQHLRDLRIDLPAGVILNPNSTPVRCTEKQLESDIEGEGCPPGSQVGTLALAFVVGGQTTGPTALYNMVPPPGHAAEFGFDAAGLGIYIHFLAGVRYGPGGYRLTATAPDVNAKLPLDGTEATFWGDPSDSSHDWQRYGCAERIESICPLPSAEPTLHPLLTMPTACPGERTLEAVADSWENPGVFASAGYDLPSGNSGFADIDFEPTLEARPTTQSGDSPTGLSVDVHVPQTNGMEEKATANLRKAVVTLPDGLVLNPSAANGLDACT